MIEDRYFFYYKDILDVDTNNAYRVYVANLKSKIEVFDLYYQSLKFPDYFGFNWDALNDSLCCLDEWMKEKQIFILHRELPHLDEKELNIYISILYDVCELWGKYPDILEFKVFFPIESKSIIQKILNNINSRF